MVTLRPGRAGTILHVTNYVIDTLSYLYSKTWFLLLYCLTLKHISFDVRTEARFNQRTSTVLLKTVDCLCYLLLSVMFCSCLEMMSSWSRQVNWGNCGIPWLNCAVLFKIWLERTVLRHILFPVETEHLNKVSSGMTSHSKISQLIWKCTGCLKVHPDVTSCASCS